MTTKMLTSNADIGFATWTNSNEQFGKYHFNEYQIDITEVVNKSPELIDGIIKTRANLNCTEFLNDADVFED